MTAWFGACSSPLGRRSLRGMFRLGGLFSPERHMTCIGYGVRFVDNRCAMPATESDCFYGQLGFRSLKANRNQSFMIIKTLQETKVNAYAFKSTMKEMLTTLFEGFGCFGVAAEAGRRSGESLSRSMKEGGVVDVFAQVMRERRVSRCTIHVDIQHRPTYRKELTLRKARRRNWRRPNDVA
ncbi:hypothetical protein MRX96_018589 [Rhipicephalus microplus]